MWDFKDFNWEWFLGIGIATLSILGILVLIVASVLDAWGDRFPSDLEDDNDK